MARKGLSKSSSNSHAVTNAGVRSSVAKTLQGVGADFAARSTDPERAAARLQETSLVLLQMQIPHSASASKAHQHLAVSPQTLAGWRENPYGVNSGTRRWSAWTAQKHPKP